MKLPAKLFVCYWDPKDPAKGFAASANHADLFDKDFKGTQEVGVFLYEKAQRLELVPEHVVLRDVAEVEG
jgi:hypothetical protein